MNSFYVFMNKIKKLFNSFFNAICVKKCVACKKLLNYDSEKLLCDDCDEEWEIAKMMVCTFCKEDHIDCRCGFGKKSVDSVRHLALYDDKDRESVVNKIIYRLKNSNDDSVFEFVADEMIKYIIEKKGLINTVCVSVPRNPRAINRYGYDHAEKLARIVADKLGIEYVNALRHRGGKTEQKNLKKQQREINAKKNCYIAESEIPKIKGRKILLIDDIGTTGAMTGVCAEILKNNGALKVKCVLAAKSG